MFLQSFLPPQEAALSTIMVYSAAYIGIILLAYAIFIEQEHRQDLIRAVGAAGLLCYGMFIQNSIITVAMGAVLLFSLIEFFEILLGLHKHGPEDLKKYKQLWRIKK